MTTTDTAIARLTRDLREAAATLSDKEARFLVDQYYIIQEDRKRSGNQVRTMEDEPHATLEWYFDNARMLETHIKSALQSYAESKQIGRWMLSIYGIGPVISAGVISRVDINKAPTAGHIWRYAGLDPTVKWEKGQKRPWDASLKTLCWHIGQSFMKFSGREECFYGKLYLERKAYEIDRNDTFSNKALAAELMPKFNKKTEAYKHLAGGKLPPAQIDARARRWAVKLFLSHLHEVWYRLENGTDPPAPFSIAIQGHAHYIPPPTSQNK